MLWGFHLWKAFRLQPRPTEQLKKSPHPPPGPSSWSRILWHIILYNSYKGAVAHCSDPHLLLQVTQGALLHCSDPYIRFQSDRKMTMVRVPPSSDYSTTTGLVPKILIANKGPKPKSLSPSHSLHHCGFCVGYPTLCFGLIKQISTKPDP